MTTTEPDEHADPGGRREDDLRHIVREGTSLGWNAPSRFRGPGLAARRALRRVLRPYEIRQREVDRALLESTERTAESLRSATRALEARVARLERGMRLAHEAREASALDPASVVDAETVVGSLWLNTADTLMTPSLVEHGHHEAHLTALLRQHLRPGMTFVDVGANIGYFSVLASELVGPEGLVIAVEPGPESLPLLRANLRRNGCTNATVLPIAAYDHRGHVQFVLNPKGGAGNWIQPGEVEWRTVLVPCARLDDLLDDLRVDVLKIDAEGSDALAVRGAEATIRRSEGITVVTEFWTQPFGGYGEAPSDVLDYYTKVLGLRPFLLEATGAVTPIAEATLLGLAATVPFLDIVMR